MVVRQLCHTTYSVSSADDDGGGGDDDDDCMTMIWNMFAYRTASVLNLLGDVQKFWWTNSSQFIPRTCFRMYM